MYINQCERYSQEVLTLRFDMGGFALIIHQPDLGVYLYPRFARPALVMTRGFRFSQQIKPSSLPRVRRIKWLFPLSPANYLLHYILYNNVRAANFALPVSIKSRCHFFEVQAVFLCLIECPGREAVSS